MRGRPTSNSKSYTAALILVSAVLFCIIPIALVHAGGSGSSSSGSSGSGSSSSGSSSSGSSVGVVNGVDYSTGGGLTQQGATCSGGANSSINSCGGSSGSSGTTATPPPPANINTPSCTSSGKGGNTTCTCHLSNGTILQPGQTVVTYPVSNVPYGQTCTPQTHTCNTNGTLSGTSSGTQVFSCTVTPPVACTVGGVTVPSGTARTFYSVATAPAGQLCSSATYSQARTCTNGVMSGSASYSIASCTSNLSCTLDGATVASGVARVFYSQTIVPVGQICDSGTYALSRTCVNGVYSGSSTFSHSSCKTAPTPAISSFTVMPNVVHLGSSTTASWSVVNIGSCTLLGTNGDTKTSAAATVTYATAAIKDATTYTLTCTGTDGVTKVTSTKKVQIAPAFQEI